MALAQDLETPQVLFVSIGGLESIVWSSPMSGGAAFMSVCWAF